MNNSSDEIKVKIETSGKLYLRLVFPFYTQIMELASDNELKPPLKGKVIFCCISYL